LLVLAALLTGCGADACETLCARTRQRLSLCLDSWGLTWEDLDATGPRDFRVQCEDDWAETRAELEPREVGLAVETCDDTLTMLAEVRGCEALYEVYFR
jgi:hypothetical protein